MDGMIADFVDGLEFESAVLLAKILGCDPEIEYWLDDDYPEKECEMKDEINQEMCELFIK